MTPTKSSTNPSQTAGPDYSHQNPAWGTEVDTAPEDQPNTTAPNCKAGWTNDEIRKLASVLFPRIEMQKQYGRSIDPKLVMRGWQVKMAHRFSVDQILFALDVYTETHSDLPAPSDIIQILNPEPPQISDAEYVQAQRWQEANGYPIFSEAKDTIEKYRAQAKKRHDDFKTHTQKLAALSNTAAQYLFGSE